MTAPRHHRRKLGLVALLAALLAGAAHLALIYGPALAAALRAYGGPR